VRSAWSQNPTAALLAAGGGAVARILIGGRASRPVSVALAVLVPATIVSVWA
jgi:hypothetical protein